MGVRVEEGGTSLRGLRVAVGFVLVAIIVASGFLIAATHSRALQSTRAVRAFEVEFSRFDRGGAPEQFAVGARIVNSGRIPAEIEFVRLSLAYRNELLASDEWHPDGLRVDAGGEVQLSRDLLSPLNPHTLPDPRAPLDPEDWSLRVHLRIVHPVSRQAIGINRQPQLKPR